MKSYTIPTDTNEKEKIIGGILNINQFFWILAGFILGLITFGVLFFFIGKTAIFFGALVSPAGVPFVVVKKEGLTLYEYMKRNKDFKKKNKILPNKTTKERR